MTYDSYFVDLFLNYVHVELQYSFLLALGPIYKPNRAKPEPHVQVLIFFRCNGGHRPPKRGLIYTTIKRANLC